MTDIEQRPAMCRPDKKAGDALLEKMESVEATHTEKRSDPAPSSTTLPWRWRSRAVREAFESTTDQPNFRVISYKNPTHWIVDSFPEPGFDRMSVREFAPCVRHPNRLRRMYHQATYAGLRIVVNAMLAGILHEMIVLRRKDTNQTEISHFEDEINS